MKIARLRFNHDFNMLIISKRILAVAAALILFVDVLPAHAQTSLSRERTMREWEVEIQKMQTYLDPLMEKHGIDMWIIMSRENNHDPVLDLFGEYGLTGWYGHRNAYIFYNPGDGNGLEAVVFGTHLSDHLKRFFPQLIGYHSGKQGAEGGLAPLLREYVHEKDPQAIAINQSRTISMADGLSVEMKKYLVDAIGSEYASRLVSSEPLLIDYVSHRTPGELAIEMEASWRTWHILQRAFSNEVVTPGETTLMDVYWWILDEWKSQDLKFNFPPSFGIQRRGVEGTIDDSKNPIILPGDVLHVDFGVRMMGLVTDQQKMAYVLKPGETAPPEGIQKAFANSVRMAEIIEAELKPGVLGYEVKYAAEARGQEEGIQNSVYPHVQGNWVHGAGAWVSPDWPERYGIHPRQPVRTNEFWSIEYSATASVPEWGGQKVTMAREEDAWIDSEGELHYMTGPQERLWLIRTYEEYKAPVVEGVP